jgi:anti-sigma B factor antagonist
MKIISTQQAGGCIISISGRVDSLTSGEVGKFFDEQVEKGNVHLVADLSQVDYMSSSGLRVLISTLKCVRQHHGDLHLAGPQDNLQQLLDLAGFTSIFKIYPTSSEAIEAFTS